MAQYRQLYAKMWKDGWFLDLPEDFKLLFIYLFSNETSNLTGLYELPARVMAFETGMPVERVREGLAAFDRAGKVLHRDGWLWVVNLLRYNASNLGSPKMRKHVRRLLERVPEMPLKERWLERYGAAIGAAGGEPTDGEGGAPSARGRRTVSRSHRVPAAALPAGETSERGPRRRDAGAGAGRCGSCNGAGGCTCDGLPEGYIPNPLPPGFPPDLGPTRGMVESGCVPAAEQEEAVRQPDLDMDGSGDLVLERYQDPGCVEHLDYEPYQDPEWNDDVDSEWYLDADEDALLDTEPYQDPGMEEEWDPDRVPTACTFVGPTYGTAGTGERYGYGTGRVSIPILQEHEQDTETDQETDPETQTPTDPKRGTTESAGADAGPPPARVRVGAGTAVAGDQVALGFRHGVPPPAEARAGGGHQDRAPPGRRRTQSRRRSVSNRRASPARHWPSGVPIPWPAP